MQINQILETLFSGQEMDLSQSRTVFNAVMQGDVDQISLTALLVALKIKGESTDEIAGAASAMIENARPFPRPDYAFSDIVGTGGDGHNTINISSAAALVAAACGIKVAKHGNKSVSSKTGSSDFFANFGLNLMMSPNAARRCMDQSGFCFLAAPNYHSGMAHVMPVRTQLKTRTLFNILGPLANPAQPSHGIYGVYSPELLDTYAQVLASLGHEHALVVHGSGLDEITLHDKTEARLVTIEGIQPMTITPEDFGAQRFEISDLQGGEPELNKTLIESAISGSGATAHAQAIAVNAAALIWVNNRTRSLSDCFEQAMQVMQTDAPLNVIKQAALISQEENA